jgi:hypothetical protein
MVPSYSKDQIYCSVEVATRLAEPLEIRERRCYSSQSVPTVVSSSSANLCKELSPLSVHIVRYWAVSSQQYCQSYTILSGMGQSPPQDYCQVSVGLVFFKIVIVLQHCQARSSHLLFNIIRNETVFLLFRIQQLGVSSLLLLNICYHICIQLGPPLQYMLSGIEQFPP